MPGCGSGHEVVALARAGFDVTAIDYAADALRRTRASLDAVNSDAKLIEADVLTWDADRAFEAIYEQTCLCALYPDQWRRYADQLLRWLTPNGTLYALFVQVARPAAGRGAIEGPPYHCDINAMRALFPDFLWTWPKPPYPLVAHPRGFGELAVALKRHAP